MKNSDIVVMTTAKAKPGKEESVQQALTDVAKAARAQSGCIKYSILRSAENPAVTVNFERWASKAERDTFLAGVAVKEFAASVSDSFAEPPKPLSYEMLDGS